MDRPKKPQKEPILIDKHTGKPVTEMVIGGSYCKNNDGVIRNRAIDEYEAYLPNVDELGILIYQELTGWGESAAKEHWTAKHVNLPSKDRAYKLAQKIAERIGKNVI